MEFGKLSFNKQVDWSKWTFKEFETTFLDQIKTGCSESVKEIAEKLGIKVPKEKTKDESQ